MQKSALANKGKKISTLYLRERELGKPAVGCRKESQNYSWMVQRAGFLGEAGVCWWWGVCPASLAPLDLLGSVSIWLISFKSPGAIFFPP